MPPQISEEFCPTYSLVPHWREATRSELSSKLNRNAMSEKTKKHKVRE